MGLRDPLVSFREDEEPDAYLARAMEAAKAAGGSGRLRLEVGSAFTLNAQARRHCSASLWVERGSGRTESWQKVTGVVLADSYDALLTLFARALDAAAV